MARDYVEVYEALQADARPALRLVADAGGRV
jgi:hypothetical protein